MKKLQAIGMVLLLFITFLFGCGKLETKPTDTQIAYDVYYLNSEATKISPYEVILDRGEVTEEVAQLIQTMATKTNDVHKKAPLTYDFSILNATLDGEQIILNFSSGYRELGATTEILVRAAIVRTLTQVEGVSCVSIQIEEEPLTDTYGNPIGVMTGDQFVDNSRNQINAYETATLNLYFASENGDTLVAEKREVEYSSNITLEKIVTEQIIKGPKVEGAYPTINPDTAIISVTVKDSVCYVNLSQDFLTQTYNVSTEVTLYSLVNSLVELTNINKVQILVEGDTDILYRERISLNTLFERNLDILKKENP